MTSARSLLLCAFVLSTHCAMYTALGEDYLYAEEYWWGWQDCPTIPDNGDWPGRFCWEVTTSGAPAGAQVTRVVVEYWINHSYVGDLYVYVTTQGDSGEWRDCGMQGLCDGACTYDSTMWCREGGNANNIHETDVTLSAFDGLSPNRTWYVCAYDATAAEEGCLDGFKIWVYYEQGVACTNCPGFNYTLDTPTTSWQTDSWSVPVYGCEMDRVWLESGRTYTFKTGCGNGATANFDTVIEVFRPSGDCPNNPHWANDDACESNRSKVTCTPAASGWHYVKIRGYGASGGSYTLAYREEPSCTPPTVSDHPDSATICPGQSHQFCVSASGSSPLSYQWRRNGSNIPGATSSCHTATQAGSYECVVSNSCGSATSNSATLTVNSPPSISSHPDSATICPGQSHQFCVSASGSSPLSYQWRRNGSNIPGATSSCYTATQAGSYDCVVSNSCGSATSNSATLTVNSPPSISSHPASGTVCQGQSYPFCVSASGTTPLSYQWRRNGSNIPGATSSCYTATQAGSYDCVVSNSCNSATSSSATLTIVPIARWYRDQDADGYGDPTRYLDQCDQPSGYVANDDDCDDTRASVHPGAPDICGNGVDDDCVGGDLPCAPSDSDGDGDPDNSDCNDSDASIHHDATEVCDGKDNDCDGQTDEDGVCDQPRTWYRDADGDGHGNRAATTQAVQQPSGYVANDDDCNDNCSSCYPGGTEVCDGKDNDCDGQTDEGDIGPTWYRDADADGYGNSSNSVRRCTQPTGYVSNDDDCNDNCSSCYPGGTEVCDGKDNDCDGQTDEGDVCGDAWYRDADGDGYGNPAVTTQAVQQPAGYVANAEDCNDADAQVNPGIADCANSPDGIDNDCNGLVDDDQSCRGGGLCPVVAMVILAVSCVGLARSLGRRQ